MSLPTIYHPSGFESGNRINLVGKEAWHAIGVRRLSVGDAIRVMDGRGGVAISRVETVAGPRDATLVISDTDNIPRQAPDIILATAIAKGDRQSTMLDMATQLGISTYQPLDCDRSVSKVGKNSMERWQRICLEACKQSGAAWLPEIREMSSPIEVARHSAEQGRQVIFAHPSVGAVVGRESDLAQAMDKITILIGPEGGFTEHEVTELLTAGAMPVDLGQQILRIETAAVALLSSYRIIPL